MAWPQSHEYNEAIQHPGVCFADPELRHGRPVTSVRGLPIPVSGTSGDVYQVRSAAGDKSWAVKCFTREVPGLCDRYREIGAHLRAVNLRYTVGFQFLDRGIRIHGRWFPVVKMGWVAGSPLNAFVRSAAGKPQWLEMLAQKWLDLARAMREARIAHGDLQHGNVLLVPDRTGRSLKLKLVDYDGMFVPALGGATANETGHRNFQHPQRFRDSIYDIEVDRFSHLVIYCALRCLAVGGRALWGRYDNGENLLFREADFQEPDSSPLLRDLWRLGPPVRELVGQLILASRGPIDRVPLLDDLVAGGGGRGLGRAEVAQLESLLACRHCRGRGSRACGGCDGEGKVWCEACQGSGECPCPACQGSGDVPCHECLGNGESGVAGSRPCAACQGNGSVSRECPRCVGGVIMAGLSGAVPTRCPYCQGVPVQFVMCSTCQGAGSIRRPAQRCGACGGTGKEECPACDDRHLTRCAGCRGTGEAPCPDCAGTGTSVCRECQPEVFA
jgi:hypothetical protein